jgi:hypothetical protein
MVVKFASGEPDSFTSEIIEEFANEQASSIITLLLMLPIKHLTQQDKRALILYFTIALLSAACLAFVMLYLSDFKLTKQEISQPSPARTR